LGSYTFAVTIQAGGLIYHRDTQITEIFLIFLCVLRVSVVQNVPG
jgi:hypothetical protein